jgi:hypothetical protein
MERNGGVCVDSRAATWMRSHWYGVDVYPAGTGRVHHAMHSREMGNKANDGTPTRVDE